MKILRILIIIVLLGTINLFQIHLCWRNENMQGIRLLNKHRCCLSPRWRAVYRRIILSNESWRRKKRERSLRSIVYLLNADPKQKWFVRRLSAETPLTAHDGRDRDSVPSRERRMWFCAFTKKWAERHVWFQAVCKVTHPGVYRQRCWVRSFLLRWRWHHMSWRWHHMLSFKIVTPPGEKWLEVAIVSLLKPPIWNISTMGKNCLLDAADIQIK